jgi:hypothetical protein
MRTTYGFKIVIMFPQFKMIIWSFDVFQVKLSLRFLESRRRIGNWVHGFQRKFICITNFLVTRLCCWRTFSENCGLSLQSFSEILWIPKKDLHLSSFSWRTANGQSISKILRISEKVWPETHQNLKWLSQIKGTSLKFKKPEALPIQV